MKKMIICIAVLAVIGLSIQGYNALQQPGNTGKVIVSWDANTEADLAGYKIYWGKASRSYFYNIDVGNITSKQIEGLETGTRWCFAVTAYDTAKNESDFSEEVSIYLPGGGDDDTTVVEVNIGYYNFPNPFNPRSNWTNIRYDLKETKQVAIDIYDDRENLVINLIDGEVREPGEHLEEWNGRDQDGDIVQNGVYYAILLIGTKMYVVQMSVIQ